MGQFYAIFHCKLWVELLLAPFGLVLPKIISTVLFIVFLFSDHWSTVAREKPTHEKT